MLKDSNRALWHEYDLAMLDLDGVVYIGPDAVDGVAERLEQAVEAGMHLAYVTNNASRPPRVVAEHLTRLGIPARDDEVVTSAQAAARLLAERLLPDSAVFVIGGAGLFEALAEEGLRPVQSTEDQPVAVVSGYNPDLPWSTVTDGAILVKNGLPWVASNTDLTVPTPQGPGPGNGVLVEAVARFAGREPLVAGKPLPPLFEETRRRVEGTRPLVIGDRLDTDIEGGQNTGLDTLLVLTGVTGVSELVSAPPNQRPSYISPGLEGLAEVHRAPRRQPDGFELGGWRAAAQHGTVKIDGEGSVGDWWRVLATAAWSYLDETGECVDVSTTSPPR
ncbi:MAG TPA: HAD-IIA family hydrolase [Nocardioidaceae bacterium]|nr:HAD-IIA family hydrolase [Nocardioidaceae bacterium]